AAGTENPPFRTFTTARPFDPSLHSSSHAIPRSTTWSTRPSPPPSPSTTITCQPSSDASAGPRSSMYSNGSSLVGGLTSISLTSTCAATTPGTTSASTAARTHEATVIGRGLLAARARDARDEALVESDEHVAHGRVVHALGDPVAAPADAGAAAGRVLQLDHGVV